MSEFVESEKKHRSLNIFVIYVLTLIAIYDLFLEVLIRLKHMAWLSTTLVTIVGLILYSIVLLIMILHMGYPLKLFGFNLKHYKKNLWEASIWTAIFCAVLFLLKFILIQYTTLFQNFSFIYHPKNISTFILLLTACLYFFFAFLQVFIIQGAIQTSLILMIGLRQSIFISIVLSTLLFASFHADHHVVFALSTLIPGFMWAYLYARQRSLVGVWFSHAVIGICAFWILGYEQVLNTLTNRYFI